MGDSAILEADRQGSGGFRGVVSGVIRFPIALANLEIRTMKPTMKLTPGPLTLGC